METRYAVIDKKTGARIYKISQVDNPAIEANYISMSKEVKPVYLNAEKTCLIGPVLIPEIDILRFDEETKEYYNFRFSQEVIKQSMLDFVNDHLISESNIQHNEKYKIDGFYSENWLILDPEKDKANALGLKQKNGDLLPVGTWMTVFYPTDPTVLTDDFLKSFRGFSIEGSFYQDTVLKKENDLNLNMSLYNNLLQDIREMFGLVKPQTIQKCIAVTVKETMQIINMNDETGVCNWLNADGTIGEIVPDGFYVLDDDSILTVTNSIGVITIEEVDDVVVAETETVIAEMKKILMDQETKHKLELQTLALEFEKLKNGIQEFNHTKKQETKEVEKTQTNLDRILELKEKRK